MPTSPCITAPSTATVSAKDWRKSFGDHPEIHRSGVDFYLQTADGQITIVEVKTGGATQSIERRQSRVPRVVPTEQADQLGFILLQKWEGVVIECDDESFTAHLLDSGGKLPPHDATFSRSELPANEQSLLEAGAPFVWTLGYRQIGSTRERASVIYFRRLPTWTQKEIGQAEENGRHLLDTLGWR